MTNSFAKALKAQLGRIVLVFQGGGALGAYQVGVYEALHAAGIEPDWVIGTSIGAINGALIAGSKVDERLERLEAFWRRVEINGFGGLFQAVPGAGAFMSNFATLSGGLSGFFAPNLLAFTSPFSALAAEEAGYYSTSPLRATLQELVDEDVLNAGAPRLTVGAANVATGEMRYFDSRQEQLGLAHILASGALPPAFPAVRVGEELFWDGGILSNTPVEAVFDDNPRQNSLIFSVHIWNPHGPEPRTLWDVMSRQKDIQYASRTLSHIERQKQLHRLRHIITEIAGYLPEDALKDGRVRKLKSFGCATRMHVVRLVAAPLPGEDHTKDIDFTREGIAARRRAGREDAERALDAQPWNGEFDPMEGFILHEV
ncbi:MAG: patatin-like phospholipase family protein [Hyphomicrobiales bacterium]|nr:patatin-like phospholipase family protein [Hyphomicrobiales bacterium]